MGFRILSQEAGLEAIPRTEVGGGERFTKRHSFIFATGVYGNAWQW